MSNHQFIFGILILLIGATVPVQNVNAQMQEDVPDSALTLQVEPDTLTMRVNETAKINFKVVDKEGNKYHRDISFFSGLVGTAMGGTPTEKITVDNEGYVKAFQPGKYTVMAWATNSGLRNQIISVIVDPLAVTKIRFEGLPDTFFANSSYTLNASAFDTKGNSRDDVKFTFSSSNPDVASVSSTGRLIAHKEGQTTITAQAEEFSTTKRITIETNPVASLELSADAKEFRTGDVVHLRADVFDKNGNPVSAAPVVYSFVGHPDDMSGSTGSGLIDQDGRFVANKAGSYTIIAKAGSVSDEIHIKVMPKDVQRNIRVVGHGPIKVNMSDLWVWESVDGRDYAVTGTHTANGEAYFWDVTDPANMEIIDTVMVDARTVNDVKISEDGRIGVISREGASNRRNGLVILDVTDPSNVEITSTFDDGLTGGVHNVFIYENHIYAVNNVQKYDIINIEDPKNPYRVGRFELNRPGQVVHDVWVEDGIAYSSNFGDGLAVVDVGSQNNELGTAGGSPENPVQLASHNFDKGWNHAALPFKSKSTGDFYVVAGDEAFPGGEPAGWIHFVKFDSWDHSEEVARYEVPEAGSHNMWIKDDVLYIGYYDGGVRIVDISGELMGNLYDQGREIAYFQPQSSRGYSMTWGAQPYKGHIFIADMNSGLWALELE